MTQQHMADEIKLTPRDSWLLSVLARLPRPIRPPDVKEMEHYIAELSKDELKDAGSVLLGLKQKGDVDAGIGEIVEALLEWAERNRTTLNNDPIHMTHFEYAGTRYSLRRPVVVTVECMDALWVYHNEMLNIWGYGARREDALEDLHENFAYLWEAFAEEKDEVLDEKALALKKTLTELVQYSACNGKAVKS